MASTWAQSESENRVQDQTGQIYNSTMKMWFLFVRISAAKRPESPDATELPGWQVLGVWPNAQKQCRNLG